MLIKSRVARGIAAFSLAMVICATGVLTVGLGLPLIICSTIQSTDVAFPLSIAGGLVSFVGLGLLPCVTSKLYEMFGNHSSSELRKQTHG